MELEDIDSQKKYSVTLPGYKYRLMLDLLAAAQHRNRNNSINYAVYSDCREHILNVMSKQ